MSMLSYVVIAKPSDGRELAEEFLSKKFVWLDFPNFNGCAVQALYAVLSGNSSPCQEERSTPRADKVLPLLYANDPIRGCWVSQIPDDWVRLFAQMEDKKIPTIMKEMIPKSWMLRFASAH